MIEWWNWLSQDTRGYIILGFVAFLGWVWGYCCGYSAGARHD